MASRQLFGGRYHSGFLQQTQSNHRSDKRASRVTAVVSTPGSADYITPQLASQSRIAGRLRFVESILTQPMPGESSNHYDLVPPKPAALVESLRAFGYDLATALADLADNSLSH